MTLGSGGISPFPGGGQGEIVQWPGVYFGAVSNNADPKSQNRCLLRIPQILGSAVTTWAVSLTPLQNPPKVGTLIAAMFVGGDLDYPCYFVVDPKVTVESSDGNIQPIGTASHAGTSKSLAAADHVHAGIDNSLLNVQPVGAANVVGTQPLAARADHAHAGLAAGFNGFLEITSSTQSGSDSPAVIDMYSQLTAGQTTIDLGGNNQIIMPADIEASNTTINITSGTINLNMAIPSGYPYTTDINTGSSWGTGERAFINQLVNGLNDLIASLINRGLIS